MIEFIERYAVVLTIIAVQFIAFTIIILKHTQKCDRNPVRKAMITTRCSGCKNISCVDIDLCTCQ